MAFPANIPVGYVPPSVALTSPANPVAPASTTAFKLQGLGALITPSTPIANILALIQGNIASAVVTAANGIILQLYYGPMVSGVAAPANAAAIPAGAVAVGTSKTFSAGTTLTASADAITPFMIGGIIKNLTPGQQYWFDLAAESLGTASDYSLTNVDVSLTEIS